MCTGIVETAAVSGSGKGPQGWFKLEQMNVSYDHPTDASLDYALNIDFVNQKEGPGARVAVELSLESARKLAEVIRTTLSRGRAETGKPDETVKDPLTVLIGKRSRLQKLILSRSLRKFQAINRKARAEKSRLKETSSPKALPQGPSAHSPLSSKTVKLDPA